MSRPTSWHHASARPPNRARASATISPEASIASTRPCGTSASSDSVTRPVPQPTSSTVASRGIECPRAAPGPLRPTPAAARSRGHTCVPPRGWLSQHQASRKKRRQRVIEVSHPVFLSYTESGTNWARRSSLLQFVPLSFYPAQPYCGFPAVSLIVHVPAGDDKCLTQGKFLVTTLSMAPRHAPLARQVAPSPALTYARTAMASPPVAGLYSPRRLQRA